MAGMTEHVGLMLMLLGAIAVSGMFAGVVLAVVGYSSAGPFAVASACVGVLGTLATEHIRDVRNH